MGALSSVDNIILDNSSPDDGKRYGNSAILQLSLANQANI